jgi:DNA-binding transcriptional ArsR family regulator
MPSVRSFAPDAAFAALADSTRRAVLELLRDHATLTAGELAAAFPDISRPAVSKHLRILRDAGLVRAEQRGREWHYALDPAPLAAIQQRWLATFVPLFDESLGRLKIRVESRQRPQRARRSAVELDE